MKKWGMELVRAACWPIVLATNTGRLSVSHLVTIIIIMISLCHCTVRGSLATSRAVSPSKRPSDGHCPGLHASSDSRARTHGSRRH